MISLNAVYHDTCIQLYCKAQFCLFVYVYSSIGIGHTNMKVDMIDHSGVSVTEEFIASQLKIFLKSHLDEEKYFFLKQKPALNLKIFYLFWQPS